MTAEQILDCLNDVNEAYLAEAAPKPRRKRRQLLWGAAAACVCLLLCVMFVSSRSDTLPQLTVPDYDSGSMGFEGLLYFDAGQLSNGNPWSETMSLTTLPVYKNNGYDTAGVPRGLDQSVILKRLEDAAAALGTAASDLEEMPSYLAGDTSSVGLSFSNEDLRIEALANGTVTVFFPDGLALPESYHFTYTDTTEDEAAAVLQYLTERYADFLDFTQPTLVLQGAYNIYGEYVRNYLVYDAAGDDTEVLLNYNFRYVQFAPDDDGNLMLVRKYDGLSIGEKLGDYPILSPAQAQEKLLAGQYQTSVPVPMPGEDSIVKVELVYRGGPAEEVFLPYYRFYAELPDTEDWTFTRENGLKTYGAYYVPAVQDEYLTNVPVYDGHFD